MTAPRAHHQPPRKAIVWPMKCWEDTLRGGGGVGAWREGAGRGGVGRRAPRPKAGVRDAGGGHEAELVWGWVGEDGLLDAGF